MPVRPPSPLKSLAAALGLVSMALGVADAQQAIDLRPVEEQVAEVHAVQVVQERKASPYDRGAMEFGGSLNFHYSQTGFRKTYSVMVDPRAHFFVARGWYLRPVMAFRGVYNQDSYDEETQEFLPGAGIGYVIWQLGGSVIPSLSLAGGGVIDNVTRENNLNFDNVDTLHGFFLQPAAELRIAVGTWILMPSLSYAYANVSGEMRSKIISGKVQHRVDFGLGLVGRRVPSY